MMGEARNKSRSKAKILAEEPRCIYCLNPPDSLEHMPPIAMFKDRARPSGMEYAACVACNNGTSTADLVASFMAHIKPFDGPNDWEIAAVERFLRSLRFKAPGLADELVRSRNTRPRWLWSPSGLLRETNELDADGPILKQHLDVFSAKLGMALYREHTGHALPETGAVFTTWFLNAGLTREGVETMLSIMPSHSSLRQGTKTVTEQFAYRYNTDDTSIVAALVGFHGNLHILAITTADYETYDFIAKGPNICVTRPGSFAGLVIAK